LKAVGYFSPAEQPVRADVSKPDQRDLRRRTGVGDDAHRAERDREELRVQGVIGDRPHLRPEGIAGGRQIRSQDERHEEDPAEVLVEIDHDCGSRDCKALQTEQQVRKPLHHRPTVTP
jgi:hypothetical protein